MDQVVFPVTSDLIVAVVVFLAASRAADLEITAEHHHELDKSEEPWARWFHLRVKTRLGSLIPRATTAPDAEVTVFVHGSRSIDGERWSWTGGERSITLRREPNTIPIVVGNIDGTATHTLGTGWQLPPRVVPDSGRSSSAWRTALAVAAWGLLQVRRGRFLDA